MPLFELEVNLKRIFRFEAESESEALGMLEDSGECSYIDPDDDYGYDVVGVVVDGVRTKPQA